MATFRYGVCSRLLCTLFQLILSVAMNGTSIQSSAIMNLLPSASSIVNMADSQDRATFATIMKMKEEPMDVVVDSNKEEVRYNFKLYCLFNILVILISKFIACTKLIQNRDEKLTYIPSKIK